MSNLFDQLPAGKCLTAAEEKRTSHTDLVMNSMREALLYTRECCRGKIRDDALVSLCYETMAKSARIFKPGKLRFFAYCKARLRGELKRHWKNLGTVRNAETVSLDTSTPGRAGRHSCCHSWQALSLSHNAPDSSTRAYQVPEKNVKHAHEDEEPPTVLEQIGGTSEPDFERIYMNDSWSAVAEAAAKHCSDLERTVLYLAYKLQLSFEEIGDLLDLSRQFVSVTSQKAIKKIRRALKRF
jgi:RNA polymerase sigma factor (sigma-70 family)